MPQTMTIDVTATVSADIARAVIRLCAWHALTSPGRDYGPEHTASDAFVDTILDLIPRLGEPDVRRMLDFLLSDERARRRA